jgi:hypothetical protein
MERAVRQANFLLPQDLIEELRQAVPKRAQSKLVAEALRNELRRLKLEKALQRSFGAWKDSDHPELSKGATTYVRKLRKSRRIKVSG